MFRHVDVGRRNLRAHPVRAWRLMLALWLAAACTPSPSPFPPAASYTAHLVTTSKSRLCAECTFDGRHHFDSAPERLYGHVAWLYGATAAPVEKYVNFLDVFLGARQQMFLVQDNDRVPECVKIDPYRPAVSNHSWAAGAKYNRLGDRRSPWYWTRATRRRGRPYW